MKLKVAILFGGVSGEHEVSVVTGLQVVEKIDKTQFQVFPIYQDQKGIFHYFPNLKDRTGFDLKKAVNIHFGRDKSGSFFRTSRFLPKQVYLDVCYLAFHGGKGESGQLQGFLETLELPHTSPYTEASVVAMNKQLTKDVLERAGIPAIPGVSVQSSEVASFNLESISLPAIVKPAHLGSSIGIHIVKSKVELKKALLEASHIDSEIVIEKLMSDFKEYNCSVRLVSEKIEVSEIEMPIKGDEILSFADKYQKGGGKKSGGMASLVRELPAKISTKLEKQIKNYSVKVYKALNLKGIVRIDFMYSKNKKLYVTEVNPIPGSMAYYLWEASGVPFREQIGRSIKEAISEYKTEAGKRLEYKTDIVEKFVSSKNQ